MEQKGFTLIELMIVIAIIAIIFTMALSNMSELKTDVDYKALAEQEVMKHYSDVNIKHVHCRYEEDDMDYKCCVTFNPDWGDEQTVELDCQYGSCELD